MQVALGGDPPHDTDRSVAVIGGGAVGTTAAADLAAWGVDVTLFERSTIGSGSTGRAAGIVYDAFAEDVDAAVAARALTRFERLSADESVAFSVQWTPYVWFARTGDERRADAIGEQVPRMRANGRDVERIDVDDLARRWPALRTEDIEVVALAHTAGVVSPERYATVMADRAAERGARVLTDTAVTIEAGVEDGDRIALRIAGGTTASFDAVLVAAGAHTGRILSAAGRSLACKPYRVQALTVASSDDPELPILYDATGEWYARPGESEVLAGDGTEYVESDPDDWQRDADDPFESEVLERLGERVPGASLAPTDSWAGLCTATPDRNPLVGAVTPGLYVATGFHGHGVMRAPAIGELVARQLCGEDGIDSFDPGRFTGTESFPIVEGMTVEDR